MANYIDLLKSPKILKKTQKQNSVLGLLQQYFLHLSTQNIKARYIVRIVNIMNSYYILTMICE